MNKRLILIVFLISAVLTVVAWFLLKPEPTNVILQAQKHLVAERFFRVETEFSVNGVFDRPEISFGESSIDMQGRMRTDVDRNTATSPITASTFDFSLGSEGEDLVLRGEGLRADHMHYLKINEVADTLFPGIGELEGQWMRSADPFLDFLVEPLEPNLVLSDLTQEGFDEMHQALAVVQLFHYQDTLPSETIDGVQSYRYAVTLRQDAIAAIMTRIKELRTGVSSRPEDYALELAKVMSWGAPSGEVWIGKNDLRFRKIVLTSLASDAVGGAHIDMTMFLSRYGIPFEVTIPEAKDVETLLGRIGSGRLELAGNRTIVMRESGKDAPITTSAAMESDVEGTATDTSDPDTDGDGLTNSQEFFYGSDAWNPDTDGDGWDDGTEVENGMNPLGPGTLFGFGL